MIHDPLRLPIAFGVSPGALGTQTAQPDEPSLCAPSAAANDSVRRLVPPEAGAPFGFAGSPFPGDGLNGIVAQLFSIIAQILQMFGISGIGAQGDDGYWGDRDGGRSIFTALTQNGQGVDANTQMQNAGTGLDLVRAATPQ